jgi:outer membrane protein assembly factor BamB
MLNYSDFCVDSYRGIAAVLLVVSIMSACSGTDNRHWSESLPDFLPAALVSPTGVSATELLQSEFSLLIDEMNPAENRFIQQFLSHADQVPEIAALRPEAILIFPHSSDNWMPVWVMRSPSRLLAIAAEHFNRPHTRNDYRFEGRRIYELFMSDETTLFAMQLGQWLYLSQSSLAMEEITRAWNGSRPAMELVKADLVPGRLILNTVRLDNYVARETAVRYRPALQNAFAGAGVTSFEISTLNGTGIRIPLLQLEGAIPLAATRERSGLIAALSSRNHSNVLDRYISQDAAAAVLLSRIPDMRLPETTSESPANRYFRGNTTAWTAIVQTLNPNFAFAAFSSSGSMNIGEFAYLRLLDDRLAFIRQLEVMVESGAITFEQNNTWLIRGNALAELLSGGLASFDIYYLIIAGDAAIITQRPGLAQKLASDRSRRRTLHYSEHYATIKDGFGSHLSGFIYIQSRDFTRYIETLLNPIHSIDILTGQFDVLAAGFSLQQGSEQMDARLRTYRIEQETRPFDERWMVPLDGTDLAGPPVFANLGRGSRNEVLAATTGGVVVALAPDGTQIFRVSTGSDRPVGSPTVIDWYANNQMAVMIGAGNKIYAWNNNGIGLPGFPVILSENITAPLLITDITRNGLPEIVVATADRMVHVLDQRGNNIQGWPQSVNAPVRSRPIVEAAGNRRTIYAYAENVIFAWEGTGFTRAGFPVFNRSPLRGPMFLDRNHLIAGTADGTVIAIGSGEYFSPSFSNILNMTEQPAANTIIQGVQLTNGGIVVRPEITTHTVDVPEASRAGEEGIGDTTFERVNAPMLFAKSDNGSIFVITNQGRLVFTQSLGQPSMSETPPIVADLTRNGRQEVLGLAGFGRLYGWDLQRGDRFLSIPTTAMHQPAVFDLIQNNRMELIAGTREGLRCWTINPVGASASRPAPPRDIGTGSR